MRAKLRSVLRWKPSPDSPTGKVGYHLVSLAKYPKAHDKLRTRLAWKRYVGRLPITPYTGRGRHTYAGRRRLLAWKRVLVNSIKRGIITGRGEEPCTVTTTITVRKVARSFSKSR